MHAEKYFRWSAGKTEPSAQAKERVLYEMEKAYKPVRWTLPDDFMDYAAFEKAVDRLDMTSSPGIPYMKEKPTNRDWLEFDGLFCSELKLKRLWHDVQTVVTGEWESLIRVFIKQEPHKKAKVLEKRWRLIMASSLPVQVLWHMLFDFMNDKEIDQAYFIPSQQGMVPVGGGWKVFRRQWVDKGLTQGLDKSAWDWTCPYWALMLDLEFRRRMGSGARMGEWFTIAERLYEEMFKHPRIVTSDGVVWEQCFPGIMKSGCVNTISTNSHCQVMIHLLVCFDEGVNHMPLCVACGDDTLQHADHCTNIEAYHKYGVMVKSASDSIEFMGHEFTESGPHPLYMAKHMKKVRYIPENIVAQYLDSMARMYVHTRYFVIWENLAKKLGYSLPLSKDAYLYWYDHPEA